METATEPEQVHRILALPRSSRKRARLSLSKKPKSSTKKIKSSKSQEKEKEKEKEKHVVHQKDLPWKSITPSLFRGGSKIGLDNSGGILELEELDGVDVVYEQVPGQTDKKAVLKMREPSTQTKMEKPNKGKSLKEENEPSEAMKKLEEALNQPFDGSLNPEFSKFDIHQSLKRAIHQCGFSKPTGIQTATWDLAIQPQTDKNRDIIGISETGSGKTLAYSLPILQSILNERSTSLQALILVPTRELALQVRDHIIKIVSQASSLNESLNEDDLHSNPRLFARIVAICGGMSAEKQARILKQHNGPNIIVATPGRLWDIMQQSDQVAQSVSSIKYLVIDEADRMIESGHFEEMKHILRSTRRSDNSENMTADDIPEFQDGGVLGSNALFDARSDMITFVFSATMSKDLQVNLKKNKLRQRKEIDTEDGNQKLLGELLAMVDFRDENPEIIDLTPKGKIVTGLQQCKIDCLTKEKDLYLYYVLTRYPGRTLVFVSSIDTIRRLRPIMELLKLNMSVVHSDLQQRARLKSLDKFKSSKDGILLATDVAARGLDISQVDHVIHYQLPRTADMYLHRSGRTARGGREGLTLQLCSPEEKQLQRSIMRALEKDTDIPDLPIEYSIFDQLRARLDLAKEADSIQHKMQKDTHEENWVKQAAEALEVELDSDMDLFEDQKATSKKKTKQLQGQLNSIKAQLNDQLSRPLKVKGLSLNYITSNSQRDFVDRLLSGNDHGSVLGMRKSTALEDVKKPAKQKRHRN